MTATMVETQELYRGVWATANDATLLIDGTSRAGIELPRSAARAARGPVSVPVFVAEEPPAER